MHMPMVYHIAFQFPLTMNHCGGNDELKFQITMINHSYDIDIWTNHYISAVFLHHLPSCI